MNRRALVGISTGTALLLTSTVGGVYWFKGSDVPATAVASGTETGDSDRSGRTATAGRAAAAQTDPGPRQDFADLQSAGESPARFQFPESASPVSPAGSHGRSRSG